MKSNGIGDFMKRCLAMGLIVLMLFTDGNVVYALDGGLSDEGSTVSAENADAQTDTVSDGDAANEDSVSGSDAATGSEENDVSSGNAYSVSDGDAENVYDGDTLPAQRLPEVFYEEEKLEDYGSLVSFDIYSRTYHVEGNQYVTVIGNDGTTYLDENGNLRRVDNRLVERPALLSAFGAPVVPTYQNGANDYTVLFPIALSIPGESAEASGITIMSGIYQMCLYPAEGSFLDGVARNNAIRYNNVFPDIDYQYTVLGNSVKEDILLLDRGEKNSFSYFLDTNGLAVKLENNTLYLYEEGTNPVLDAVFVLEAPEMEDAAGELSFGVTLSLEETEVNGEAEYYLVTVAADREWLDASERVYPVRIDPTAIQVTSSAIRIACAEEGSPNTAIGDNQYPYVGYDDGVRSGNYAGFGSRHLNCRSYFAVDYDFSSLAAEAEIVSATFQVTQKTRWSKGETEFGLYGVEEAWEVNGLTWNNQTDYNHYFLDSSITSTIRGEALSFDVTEEVSAWIHGTAENHGFVMKAQVEAPGAEAAAQGVMMQCEVFYNNASASYAPKLILSWTGEPTVLEDLTLDDTTIEIYPVVERNGDKSTNTLGVVAHGLAKPGSTVHYSLVNGTTGAVEAQTTLCYPDSTLYKGAFPSALEYNRKLSNWQSQVFTGLVPGQVYYISAYAEGNTASPEEEPVYGIGQTVNSEPFLIYEEGAFDLIPRIALHYGVEVDTIMADMRMQDALTKEGNRIFIRNPQNTAPYVAGELSDYWKAVIDGLLLGRAENCEFGFEPVNLNTGNFYMEQSDAELNDIGGSFAFTRQYNAKGAAYTGSLGFGWSFAYDERLGELADGTLLWISATGSIVPFSRTGNGYVAPTGYDYVLTEEAEGYSLMDLDTLSRHIFNGYGMLTGLEDVQGNQITLSYDMEYRLAAITSPSGKRFDVTLDGENRISVITLPDGGSVRYAYDSAGDLVSVTNPAGESVRYSYDEAHRMTAWYDENGNQVVANTYDAEGRVTEQMDAEGGRVLLSYGEGSTTATDENGNVTVYYYDESYRTTGILYSDGTKESRSYNAEGYRAALTDREGVTTSYTYDADGHMLSEIRQDGTERSYTYTDAGQIASLTDYDGAVTSYTYDEKNRLTSVTDAEGGRVIYTYDEANRLIKMTDANGYTTSYTYDGACITTLTDGEGNIWRYAYDAMNRQTAVTDPLGNTSRKTYNAKGWCIAEIDAAGNATAYTYDGAGNVTAITDREGQRSVFDYDKMNRMLSGTDPLGNTLTYTYDAAGNKLTETDAEGNMTAYTYDTLDRLIKITDAKGNSILYTYDGANRIVNETDRRGYTHIYTYDAINGGLLTETDEEGNTTSYKLDACGRITEINYADGSVTSYSYDRLGRMTAVTNQLGTVTTLSYDAAGNLISMQDAEDRVYTYTYDGLGRLIASKDPLGGTVNYVYDKAGNLLNVTDERGNTTVYTYDALNRLVEIQDALLEKTTYTYDKENRLLSVTTPEGRRTVYTYDAIGQLIEMRDALEEEDGSGTVTSYTYDGLSRLLSVSDEAGTLQTYDYDALGRLTGTTDALGSMQGYRMDEEGNLLVHTYPNGEKEIYTYLGTGEVASYTDRYGVRVSYTYDELGKLAKVEDTIGNKMIYEYDAAGNLVKQTDVLGRSAVYAYDAFGRLVSFTDVDGAVTTYAYDALDRLISVTDAAGNVTTYSYDAVGNLTGMIKPGEAKYLYAYNEINRLIKQTDPEGGETVYAYDGDGNLISVIDGNGVTNAYTYDALSRLIAFTDGNGGQTRYAYDIRNNLLSITTPEGNQEQYGYDAAGNILTVTNGLGEIWNYEYDELYRLVKQTSPLGAVESYTYDKHDVVTQVADVLGAVTDYEVNANGQVEKQTLPNGGVYTYTYDEVHRLTSVTTPLGYEAAFTYSIGDDVLKEEDNLGRTTLYEYDILHNLTKVTDAEGGITSYTYDVRSNRTAMTNALGNTFSFAYDGVDRMITVTDPEEKAASLVYDMVGNALSITTPGERTTGYTYDGNYNILTLTDPKGYVYTYSYDKDDRLIGTVDPLAQTTAYAYDAANRITLYTDKMGLTERYTYDAHGNVLSAEDTMGLVTNYTYDIKNRMLSVTDPQGSTAYYTYDVMDNLTAVTDYMGRGTYYTYDLLGNLTSVTDASGRREEMSYDIVGRLTSYTSNGGNKITYDYDKLNHLVEKAYEDAKGEQSGETVAYAYNALGERVAMYDSTGDTEYTYDSLGRIIGVTTYRTPGEDGFSHDATQGDRVVYTYDEADNLSAITYPDGTQVNYAYDLNDNLVKVTDREGMETTYVYDAINRITEIHRPNGISTYNTYNARNQIIDLINICDDCGWVVSSYSYTYDERGFIIGETAIESLAGYAYDEKHNGRHEDGRHDSLYPHGNKHAKHDKDATFAYQIVQINRSFTYDEAGKLLSATETEDNYGTYSYTYEYDPAGNRTAVIKRDEAGTVAESEKYIYNESDQLVSAELYDGKKTTSISYAYDADGNLISEIGREGTDKVERYYSYTVENRLEAVYDGKELLMAAAYDGDGNRVFQLNYNLHTDEDWKGNSGNGNGNNKDNSGSGNGNNGNGNASNAESNNSQNQSGILFPIDSEVSNTEDYLIGLIKTDGKEKDYELIEYINDVNREYVEVLTEQNINGVLDTAYVYGVERLSTDRFDGSTGYYLYDPRGNVTGITNEEGQIYQSYRYSAFGEITFGAPQYENEYTYNGESYNPNIQSQYLRARYYCVVTAAFITEDFYPADMWALWDITEPLTLNRYNYCVSSPLNYTDKSGHSVEGDIMKAIVSDSSIPMNEKGSAIDVRIRFYHALQILESRNATFEHVMNYDYVNNMDGFYEALAKADETIANIKMGMELAEERKKVCYISGEDFNTEDPWYIRNRDIVAQIIGIDARFSEELEHFSDLYFEYRERYEALEEKTGVPAELIAAIHYHESASDFDWKNGVIYFSVYLHNGQPLGSETTIAPKGILFGEDEFDKAVIDALEGKWWSEVAGTNEGFKSSNMAAYNATDLKNGNNSLIAMLTFAEYYNGRTPQPSTYLFNGALNNAGENIPGDGKYIKDNEYDPNAINQQPGIYLLLISIIEVYDK